MRWLSKSKDEQTKHVTREDLVEVLLTVKLGEIEDFSQFSRLSDEDLRWAEIEANRRNPKLKFVAERGRGNKLFCRCSDEKFGQTKHWDIKSHSEPQNRPFQFNEES